MKLIWAAVAAPGLAFRYAPVPGSPLHALHSTAGETAVPSSSAPLALSPKRADFSGFDYGAHWYPVVWARDLRPDEPTRVTLFDVDYVVARTTATTAGTAGEEDEAFYALVDECPHKKVALSEGRMTKGGDFQCSYHGWSFDGSTGRCVEIPQTIIAKQGRAGDERDDKPQQSGGGRRRREDATSVAVTVVQGMVWLQPNYTPLEALAAAANGTLSGPPTIPEIDEEGYKTTVAIRDFPIDWTVLTENIMDPDHGHFAHSAGQAGKGFDLYVSDGVENKPALDEEWPSSGWKATNSVPAVEKLIAYNSNFRLGGVKKKNDSKKKTDGPTKMATTIFQAPSVISMGRRDNATAPAAFVSGFWVSPTGVGRSRFMASATVKSPISVPRWATHMNLNNFLDQDTYLLVGQNRATLKREAEGYLAKDDSDATNPVRKSTYVYRSPSEKLPTRLGQFFDATLSRSPNRREGVLAWYRRNTEGGKLIGPGPSRREVLDRHEQHTKICPDSSDLVDRCDLVMKRSRLVAVALVLARLLLGGGVGGVAEEAGGPLAKGIIQRTVGLAADAGRRLVLLPGPFVAILAAAAALYRGSSLIKREFHFKTDEGRHRHDVKAISDMWADL